MPKLPLDPAQLRELPGTAIKALRHPRRSAAQIVSGTFSLVGGLLDRRPVHEPVPGATTTAPEPPPTDVAVEPPEAAATDEGATADEWATAAAPPESQTQPEAPTDEPPAEEAAAAGSAAAETAPAGDAESSDRAEDMGDTGDTGESTDVLSGPVPHMPPSIAQEVERDYGEDLPGVSEPGRG